ncbi:hypothetical protein HMPREF9420_1743 [Segatella salivae DSM 15606]|uniref:Uncharacterized protein n=1 Tax=Segatella salivae DSM 15606 TaxID=888832 RepID=E6MQH5_9BACT|nr:hypothetical protein HMPREF9420_1743 [Segatella salivae DSM 15606]
MRYYSHAIATRFVFMEVATLQALYQYFKAYIQHYKCCNHATL